MGRLGIVARKIGMRVGIGRRASWQHNDAYVADAPSAAQTVDLFAGVWASRLPIDGVESGAAPLFEDPKIAWMLDQVKPEGMSVIELGPLEGGHTSMIHAAGAREVLAIEGNKSAFLKCLVVQHLLGLPRARFELGDFGAFLAQTSQRFDLLVAGGVLYHLQDPLAVLHDMMRAADNIFIWSHFMDVDAMPPGDVRRRPFTGEVRVREIAGDKLMYHTRSYLGTHRLSAFCGGPKAEAVWIERVEVEALFRKHGYTVETAFVDGTNTAGPSACLLARRARA